MQRTRRPQMFRVIYLLGILNRKLALNVLFCSSPPTVRLSSVAQGTSARHGALSFRVFVNNTLLPSCLILLHVSAANSHRGLAGAVVGTNRTLKGRSGSETVSLEKCTVYTMCSCSHWGEWYECTAPPTPIVLSFGFRKVIYRLGRKVSQRFSFSADRRWTQMTLPLPYYSRQ